jgi:WD40 repeat protein
MLAGHHGAIDALAFRPDGAQLASGSQDGTVMLWDMATRRIWATLVGQESGVSAAAWSPAGDVLYTGGVDHLVVPWMVRPADAVSRICRDIETNFPGPARADCVRRPVS